MCYFYITGKMEKETRKFLHNIYNLLLLYFTKSLSITLENNPFQCLVLLFKIYTTSYENKNLILD